MFIHPSPSMLRANQRTFEQEVEKLAQVGMLVSTATARPSVLDCLDDPGTPSRLCLMAGSVNHDVLAETGLRRYVHEKLGVLEEGMMAGLSADRYAGLLSTDCEPRVVAPIVITYPQGLWRMALVSHNRRAYERQIDLFLIGLRLEVLWLAS